MSYFKHNPEKAVKCSCLVTRLPDGIYSPVVIFLTVYVTLKISSFQQQCISVSYDSHNTEGYSCKRGTRWRSWLRHCATNRKVAGSIPDGVTGIFH